MTAYALLAAFATSLILGLVLVKLMHAIAPRIGLVDRPGGRKQHARVTPLGGGLAIWTASVLPLLGVMLIAWIEMRRPGTLPVSDAWRAHFAGILRQSRQALAILGGGAVIMLFGILDDYRPFKPKAKLAVQLVIALAIVLLAPLRVTLWFTSPAIQIVLTTLWVVAITNAFNLLDNMDGLSSTVAFFVGLGLVIVALQTGQLFIAGYVLTLMGALCAFLFFNFPPASIFMGDCGSLYIGYTLSVSAVLASFVGPAQPNPLFAVLVPAVLFAVPIYDTVSVMAVRLHHRRPILAGDRNHFSHRLLRLGMTPRRVLFTVALVTLATALGATIPYGSATWQIVVPVIQAGAFLAIIASLELEASEIRWDHTTDKRC